MYPLVYPFCMYPIGVELKRKKKRKIEYQK